MAPVFTASRLSLPVLLFAFVLLASKDANSLCVYDHQTLLDLRLPCLRRESYWNHGNQKFLPPPFLPGVPVPACLCFASKLPQSTRRHRRRGRRSGQLVRLKAAFLHPGNDQYFEAVRFDYVKHWTSPTMIYVCLVPVTGITTINPCLRPLWHRQRGVNFQNLRTLQRAPISTTKPSTSLRISLANVRLLANKTFILKDFFTYRDLDLMLLTETWLRSGELNCFT